MCCSDSGARSTTGQTRSASCSCKPSPWSPNSKPTSTTYAPARAWPKPAQKADSKANSRNYLSRHGKQSTAATTTPPTTRASLTSPRNTASAAPPSTASSAMLHHEPENSPACRKDPATSHFLTTLGLRALTSHTSPDPNRIVGELGGYAAPTRSRWRDRRSFQPNRPSGSSTRHNAISARFSANATATPPRPPLHPAPHPPPAPRPPARHRNQRPRRSQHPRRAAVMIAVRPDRRGVDHRITAKALMRPVTAHPGVGQRPHQDPAGPQQRPTRSEERRVGK